MSTAKYELILQAAASRLWAIDPYRLNDIIQVLAFQAAGGKLSTDEIAQAIGERKAVHDGSAGAGGDTIAVLGLRGIIAHRISQVKDASGPLGTSTEAFTQTFRTALGDDRVKAIVIDVDSPGGTIDGVPELAREVRESRGQKPIVGVVNTLAASAAFWIVAQADSISITESGMAGSIGVFTAHADISKALEMQGIKMTLISAGEFKVEGNEFEPLSKAALEHTQTIVTDALNQFESAVAEGRGVSLEVVSKDFGRGRSFGAAEAVERGLADRIETLDQVIARLSSDVSSASRNARRGNTDFEFMS